MSEYIKISMTFTERLVMLFTGHLNKNHLISKTNDTIVVNTIRSTTDNESFLVTDDKLEDIPFFDFESGDKIKSNL